MSVDVYYYYYAMLWYRSEARSPQKKALANWFLQQVLLMVRKSCQKSAVPVAVCGGNKTFYVCYVRVCVEVNLDGTIYWFAGNLPCDFKCGWKCERTGALLKNENEKKEKKSPTNI